MKTTIFSLMLMLVIGSATATSLRGSRRTNVPDFGTLFGNGDCGVGCCCKTNTYNGCEVETEMCIENFEDTSVTGAVFPLHAKLALKPTVSVTLSAQCERSFTAEQAKERLVYQSGVTQAKAIIGYAIELKTGLQGSVTFKVDADLEVGVDTTGVSGTGHVSEPTMSGADLAANVEASAEVYVGLEASVLSVAAVGAKVEANASAELSRSTGEGVEGSKGWGAKITGYGQLQGPSFTVPNPDFCGHDLGIDYSKDLSIGGEVTIWEYTSPTADTTGDSSPFVLPTPSEAANAVAKMKEAAKAALDKMKAAKAAAAAKAKKAAAALAARLQQQAAAARAAALRAQQAAAAARYTVHGAAHKARTRGLRLGGRGYAFAGNYGTKGLYAYRWGPYAGMSFFGTGGSRAQMDAPLGWGNKYRP